MTVITFFLFFIYTFGLGAALTPFIRKNSFESFILRLGVGLGSLPLLGTILNFFHIPLDWRIVLIIAIFYPLRMAFAFLKNMQHGISLKLPQKHIIILLAIFLITAMIYCGGSFRYPWLEDDDPWSHAASIKYMSIEKNFNVSSDEFQYLNPYPPGYGFVLSLLHQTHYSLYWVMKFFNGLIISLGILFFYNFIFDFTKDKNRALWATLALSCVPCYLSHFIWAHALVVTLFFPALSLLLRAQDDRNFILPGSIVICGIFLTQPTQSIKFCIFVLILSLAYSLIKRRLAMRMMTALITAGLLSLSWWGAVIYEMKSGASKLLLLENQEILGLKIPTASFLTKIFDPRMGSATRAYTFQDYFTAPTPNMINNPLSLEKGIFILSIIGLIYVIMRLVNDAEEKKIYYWTTLGWLGFTFLGMNSMTFNLPVGLFAFRFWMLFAIPVCMLTAEGCIFLMRTMRKPLRAHLMAVFLLILMISTSGYKKFLVNTNFWYRGVFWVSLEETLSYIWMRENLPPDTRVFSFKDNLLVIGLDMRADFWREDYKNDLSNAFEADLNTFYDNLKKHQFQYLIISPKDALTFGFDEINKKITDLVNNKNFKLVLNYKRGARVFKIIY